MFKTEYYFYIQIEIQIHLNKFDVREKQTKSNERLKIQESENRQFKIDLMIWNLQDRPSNPSSWETYVRICLMKTKTKI